MSAFPGIGDVDCPWCGAAPGCPCVTPSGTTRRLNPHRDRWEKLRSKLRYATFIVRFIEDDPEFSINAGDEFEAWVYYLDPGEKVTLIRRLGDGFDPECNAYARQIEFVKWSTG